MPVNPTDLLAHKHKTYKATLDRYKRASAERQQAQERVEAAEQAFRAAEMRDREARGEAIVDNRRRPDAKADSARAKLEDAKRDLEAIQYAEQRAASKVDQLPERHKDERRGRARRDVAAAQRDLLAAVHQAAAARDHLATETALAAYIEEGASYTPPIGEGVHIPRDDGTLQVVAFDKLINALTAEAENAADGRHRLPAGATLPNYTKPTFWRGGHKSGS